MHLLVGLAVALQVGAASDIRIRIETPLGNIEAVVDSAKAPRTSTNFLAYVDARAYENARFHRTVRADNQPNDSVRISVIQASLDSVHRAEFRRPPVELEPTSVTGLRHIDGTLSMARAGPNTATSDFFICVGDQPSLDFGGHRNLDGQGFAAFGKVTKGMDVVKRIQASAAEGQRLTPPVTITRIVRVR